MTEPVVKVAIAADFFTAYDRLPEKIRRKVTDFIHRFRQDPTSSAINYEKVRQWSDPNLRSVRIDQAYRGVVLKPKKGRVYVLLWVDHHDRAYRFARHRICHIHPETGSLQVIDTEQVAPEAASAEESAPDLFAAYRDRNLTALGVPEILLPLIRSIKTDDDLDRAVPYLPEEAVEALTMLAAGYSLEEVYRELDQPEEKVPVDPEDFDKALENPDSRRRFMVLEDDRELEAMVNAPLERWRVFLHPTQRKVVEKRWKGPMRVLGGAGTGKTVAAMHRARWLAEKVYTDSHDRILVTTFSRNLAADIEQDLRTICSDDAMSRLEITNIDRWVYGFLRRHGYESKIAYGKKIGEFWRQVFDTCATDPDVPESFYREEWELVIQPHSITTLDDYLRISRVGRGVRLNRKARREAWPIFDAYRLALADGGYREPVDAMRDARAILLRKGTILPYRAVVVDEAQDMGYQAFRLIRALLPASEQEPSIFIVGDAHQRIYRHRVVLGRCGINIRGGRSRKLRLNYRTTEQTRRFAVKLLLGQPIDDLDGGSDDQAGYRSLMSGPEPQVHCFETFAKEVEAIAAYLRADETDSRPLASTCLVTRTNQGLDDYQAALEKMGIATYRIKRSAPEERGADGLRLATMHRVKGLQFDRVVIAGANDGIVPHARALATKDPVVCKEREQKERSLLYVATTRAKREVFISAHGRLSPFLTQDG